MLISDTPFFRIKWEYLFDRTVFPCNKNVVYSRINTDLTHLMKVKVTEKLIISLIKDDLINSKLINGLLNIGVNADCYFLHLDSTIFKLVGYKVDDYSEEIYEKYRDLALQAKHIDISDNNSGLDPLAVELYQFLENNKPR